MLEVWRSAFALKIFDYVYVSDVNVKSHTHFILKIY